MNNTYNIQTHIDATMSMNIGYLYFRGNSRQTVQRQYISQINQINCDKNIVNVKYKILQLCYGVVNKKYN